MIIQTRSDGRTYFSFQSTRMNVDYANPVLEGVYTTTCVFQDAEITIKNAAIASLIFKGNCKVTIDQLEEPYKLDLRDLSSLSEIMINGEKVNNYVLQW